MYRFGLDWFSAEKNNIGSRIDSHDHLKTFNDTVEGVTFWRCQQFLMLDYFWTIWIRIFWGNQECEKKDSIDSLQSYYHYHAFWVTLSEVWWYWGLVQNSNKIQYSFSTEQHQSKQTKKKILKYVFQKFELTFIN